MEYAQRTNPTFYATFVDKNGEAASVTSGVIFISHRWGNSTTTDVDEQAMTRLSDSKFYYEGWAIPAGGDKTTYTVKYVGAYSDGTVGVGSEEFQVIPKKFYDKKGGGFVQRVRADVWTNKEKEALLEAIEKLMEKEKIDTNLIEQRINESHSLLSNVSRELGSTMTKEDSLSLATRIGDVKELVSKLETDLSLQKSELDEHKETLKGLAGKEDYDDSKVLEKISSVSKDLTGLHTDLRNERIGHIIASLEDLRKEIDDFKKATLEEFGKQVSEDRRRRIEFISSSIKEKEQEFQKLKNTIKEKPKKMPFYYVDNEYDGIRVSLHKKGNDFKILSKEGKDVTDLFQIPKKLSEKYKLNAKDLLKLRKDCQNILSQAKVLHSLDYVADCALLKGKDGLRLYVQDLLYFGKDIGQKPLQERKKLLKSLNFGDNIKEGASISVKDPSDLTKSLGLFKKLKSKGVIIKPSISKFELNESGWTRQKFEGEEDAKGNSDRKTAKDS